MSELDQFGKCLIELGIPHVMCPFNSAEADGLARTCREPIASKSRRYVLVGGTSFHFDMFNKFVGVEHDAFEPRIQEAANG